MDAKIAGEGTGKVGRDSIGHGRGAWPAFPFIAATDSACYTPVHRGALCYASFQINVLKLLNLFPWPSHNKAFASGIRSIYVRVLNNFGT